VPYFHVVFTLPSPIGDIAYQNKAVIYNLLFRASAETMLTIAADPKHLGARIGITAVLHSWGSAMTHHPHVHMIVPGGGISLDGSRWISKRPRFFLPVRVLSKLFRRLMIEKLIRRTRRHIGGERLRVGLPPPALSLQTIGSAVSLTTNDTPWASKISTSRPNRRALSAEIAEKKARSITIGAGVRIGSAPLVPQREGIGLFETTLIDL
jgi:hypothetical protein